LVEEKREKKEKEKENMIFHYLVKMKKEEKENRISLQTQHFDFW
jgi:translation elongation factor EF-1alpha